MDCLDVERSGIKAYWRGFLDRAIKQKIPLSGALELTRRCNLRCAHCYLGHGASRLVHPGEELGTDRWLSLIDEMTAAGCLTLLLTGGEPLLREDFTSIYRRARENGLLVVVFTNGTLVTEDLLRLFQKFPPVEVEVSLYGASATTFDRVTGMPGSYEQCMRGIKALLSNGIRVNLKTILMTLNHHELVDMENMARELGVGFRFDSAITPCLNGDDSPLELRVTPEEIVAREMEDTSRRERWRKHYEKCKDITLGNRLYGCSAGYTSFYVDASGRIQPCQMTGDLGFDLFDGSFLEGWKKITERIGDLKAEADFACRDCKTINLCGYCPAFFRLETGRADIRSEFLCRIGELRLSYIREKLTEGAKRERKSRADRKTTV
ncbi:MAG: radical SAM protein [Acidobacteria bacterium]|nr:radical SAM protein [Acidobacteriota bacterium]